MTATNINKLGVWSHLHKLFENSLLPPHDPKGLRAFAGKTILIAGATSEIMVRAAIKFARLGAYEIILGARDLQIASVARDEIEVAVKRPKGFVLVLELDLSSFPSVEDFVNNVQKATSKVHAVILSSSYHNEEGINEKHEIIRSPHGSEMNLQVNVMSKAYLAIFLLALLLETSLKEECPTHLEFADIGWYGDWDFEALLNPERPILEILNKYVCPSIQFPTAKFLEMAVMYQLSKRVDPSKVIVFAACSGTCEEPVSRCPGTNISKSTKLFKRLFARTFEQGSRILVTGVLQGPRIHGKLWKDDRVRT
jgi:NAD(P)-dependent dehydrogenase (short-subunit alcohol dehydrogenase family)